jgi:hypothetical protein
MPPTLETPRFAKIDRKFPGPDSQKKIAILAKHQRINGKLDIATTQECCQFPSEQMGIRSRDSQVCHILRQQRSCQFFPVWNFLNFIQKQITFPTIFFACFVNLVIQKPDIPKALICQQLHVDVQNDGLRNPLRHQKLLAPQKNRTFARSPNATQNFNDWTPHPSHHTVFITGTGNYNSVFHNRHFN